MVNMLGRRLFVVLVLLPLLHIGGFIYARTAQPLSRNWLGDLNVTAVPFAQAWSEYWAYINNIPEAGWMLDNVAWRQSLLASGQLLGVTLLVVMVSGPLLGLAALSPRTQHVRPSAVTAFTVGSTIPGFFLATVVMIILIMGKRQGWYTSRGHLIPIQGYGFDAHLILPVCTLALRPILYTAAITASLLEHELQQPYVQFARSKGLSWRALLWRHTLPNVQAAMLIALGQSFQFVIGSLLLVEFLFDWRGLGWVMVRIFIEPGRGGTSALLMDAPLLGVLLALIGGLMVLADTLARALAIQRDPRLIQIK